MGPFPEGGLQIAVRVTNVSPGDQTRPKLQNSGGIAMLANSGEKKISPMMTGDCT